MSSTQHSSANEPNTSSSKPDTLTLPPPPSESENTTTLDMSTGEASVKMSHLGPLVVNKDGTLSRIGNWEQMSEIERKNTLRILGKRNQIRLEGLKGQEETGKDVEGK